MALHSDSSHNTHLPLKHMHAMRAGSAASKRATYSGKITHKSLSSACFSVREPKSFKREGEVFGFPLKSPKLFSNAWRERKDRSRKERITICELAWW